MSTRIDNQIKHASKSTKRSLPMAKNDQTVTESLDSRLESQVKQIEKAFMEESSMRRQAEDSD